MKVAITILALLCPLFAFAQEAQTTDEVVLRGVFDMGSKKLYSLSSPGAAKRDWVESGNEFLGYTVGEYDPETQKLTLTQGEDVFVIGLAGSSAGPAQTDDPAARLEEAKKIFQAIKFKETVGEAIDAQMKAIMDMQRQQLAQSGSPLAEDEEYLTFMDKAMRQMMESIDWDTVQTGMENIYAEVFTEAELKGITEFYSTPAGQATIAKNPELQQKSMQVMMPSIMQASQKMGESIQQYMAERAQKDKAEEEPAAE